MQKWITVEQQQKDFKAKDIAKLSFKNKSYVKAVIVINKGSLRGSFLSDQEASEDFGEVFREGQKMFLEGAEQLNSFTACALEELQLFIKFQSYR